MHFLIRLLITAAALWVAVSVIDGIDHTGPLWHLLAVALVFGIVNAVVRPVLMMLTCSLIALTLGLFVLVLNALMLLLTSALSNALGIGFHVDGFLPAFLGGLVVGITSAVLNIVVADNRKK